MPTAPALDFRSLLEGIPRGAWVALSAHHERVLAFGAELAAVVAEARAKGEQNPVITRVPETASALML